MTSEPEITKRIRTAADGLEVGDPPISRILSRGRRRGRQRLTAIAAGGLLVLGAAGAVGTFVTGNGDGGQVVAGGSDQRAVQDSLDFGGAEPAIGAPEPAPAPQSVRGAGGGAAASSGKVSSDVVVEEQAVGGAIGGSLFETGPKIIKTADLRLRVPGDRFQNAFNEVQEIAERHGGFVANSETRTGEFRSGFLTIRVPATAFQRTVSDIKRLGEVRAENIFGEDVTAQFVDLEARLRHFQAQEAVLLDLLSQSRSVADTLRVQRELQNVQLEIELLQGNLRFLRDQTELSTVSVALREAGAGDDDGSEPGAFGRAWDRAIDGIVNVFSSVIVGLGYLLPIGILIAAAWFGFRAVRARMAT
ncbi:MAG: DUF4349 domain-containing protein [Actinomycetota bacterium]